MWFILKRTTRGELLGAKLVVVLLFGGQTNKDYHREGNYEQFLNGLILGAEAR